jgi:TetR/AcrR family transcriptional regulator
MLPDVELPPKRRRNAELTKTAILDAAESEFAIHGLAGARTETIAEHTGTSKAMIYYYFPSKEELYRAVLERALLKFSYQSQALQLEKLDPSVALEVLLERILTDMSENTKMASIFSLEAIQNQGKYYPKDTSERLYGQLIQVLQLGIDRNHFRKLNPRHTAVNIIGTCAFYFCARNNINHIWPNRDMLSKEMLAEHAHESIQLILHGVRSTNSESPPPSR